jgi:hypothetical protein
MFDATTLVQDVSTALDPSALTSVLDISPIADFGTLLSTSTLPDLGEILTTLMPWFTQATRAAQPCRKAVTPGTRWSGRWSLAARQ